MKVADLKKVCKYKSLLEVGTKAVLIQRILGEKEEEEEEEEEEDKVFFYVSLLVVLVGWVVWLLVVGFWLLLTFLIVL